MQFQVPQFIETEDRILGPLTIKQFLYIAAATLIVILFYFVLATWLWVIVGLAVEGITLAFNLAKINGRPMRVLATSAFLYVWDPRVYEYQSTAGIAVTTTTEKVIAPRPVMGGLRSLLDKLTTTKQAIPNRENPLPEVLRAASRESVKERYELIRKITGDEEVARRVDYR